VDSLAKDYAAGVFGGCEPPCLSLYQPTHRHHPENQQDPIRFRNLVEALKESLLRKYSKRESQPILEPFLALAEDRDFWAHTYDGLAVLGAKGMFRFYRLQRPILELAVVADSFHTKPLMRILQSADRFQVLGLSLQDAKLFEGNRDALDEVELAQGVPRTLTEALGEELTEPHQTVASYGGVGGSHQAMHHGHGGRETEADIDAKRFFRAVDRGILEHYSRPSALPLILATLPEHRQLFHQVSHNPWLMDEGIDANPRTLPIDELRLRAWGVVEPHYLARLAALVEDFGRSRSEDLGHEELAHVARAVVAGRVATLLIEADREVPGRVNTATGDIELGDMTHPEVDDVLDDLGALALKMGGQIVIVPTGRMPTDTGIAAIYRY
jgi:hypothetical protein